MGAMRKKNPVGHLAGFFCLWVSRTRTGAAQKKSLSARGSRQCPKCLNPARRSRRRCDPVIPAGLKAKDMLNKSAPAPFEAGAEAAQRPWVTAQLLPGLVGVGGIHSHQDGVSATPRCQPAKDGRPAAALESVVASLALFKSLPAGARWITVHPNGSDSKGQPVMIHEDSKGTWRVVGGAGGKLNYLRLRGVRSEADYRKEAAARAKAGHEAKAAQRRKEKEAGTYEARSKQREEIRRQRIDVDSGIEPKVFVVEVSNADGDAPSGISWPAAAGPVYRAAQSGVAVRPPGVSAICRSRPLPSHPTNVRNVRLLTGVPEGLACR